MNIHLFFLYYKLDLGDSNADADKTTLISTSHFDRKHATGSGKIELAELIVERGISWEEAREKANGLTGPHDGFYLAREVRYILYHFSIERQQ